MIFFTANSSMVFANKANLYNDIIDISSGSIIESGIRIKIENNKGNQYIVNNILEEIIKIDNSEEFYYEDNYIGFKGHNIYGFIDCTSKEGNITVEIAYKNEKSYIESLKAMAMNIIKNKTQNMVIFEYIKVSLPENTDLENLNTEIGNDFKLKRYSKIDSIKLNNGYSSIVNMNAEKSKESINYALCKYNSGKYLIIGTPEIVIPY